jgi:hypothetical protein
VYNILDGRPEGKRPLGKIKRGWENNFEMDCEETMWSGFIWLRQGTSGGLL